MNEFHFLLGRVGAEHPLVLVLDGLDELSEEHGQDLTWLSVPVPPHVHLVLSATTGSACAHTLQVRIPGIFRFAGADIVCSGISKCQTESSHL